MKKMIVYGIISILIGFFLGSLIFTKKELLFKEKKENKYYFLQEGVYSDKSIIKDSQLSTKPKVIEYLNDKIYIYVGITKDLEVAEKLVSIYENNNIKLSIKEKYNSNEELKNNVEQFDFLINSTKDNDEILKIEEVVLANYEEIIDNSAK